MIQPVPLSSIKTEVLSTLFVATFNGRCETWPRSNLNTASLLEKQVQKLSTGLSGINGVVFTLLQISTGFPSIYSCSTNREISRETVLMKASAMADEVGTKFTDLPEDCICKILWRTSPTDIIRSSAVSKSMQSVVVSDKVWDHFVPPEDHCRRILATVAIPNIVFTSKIKLFSLLRDPVLVDNEKKMIWLEPSTGKICYMISAMALRIVWGTTPAYWGWESRADSRFRQVAVLKEVCWLEITGNIDCNVLSIDTKYRVSFMVKMSQEAYGWDDHPVTVSIKLPDGEKLQNSQMLDSEGISLISSDLHTTDGWIRLVAGEFTVHADWDAQPVEFSLLELESGWWKSGLIFDGVMLEPLTGIDTE